MNQIYIKNIYQTKFSGDKTQDYQKFEVTIDNVKMTKKVQCHTEAPVIKYHKKLSNSCCSSSLISAFHFICDNRAVAALVNRK